MIEVVFLGTSSMVPTKDRNQSATFINSHGSGILLDCGEGCQMRLRKYFPKTHKIGYVFISSTRIPCNQNI